MTAQNICQNCGAAVSADAPRGLCPACLMKVAVGSGSAGDEKSKGFIPPTVAELAAKFPQLVIIELIGRGGMGAVYKARQKELDRIVALKILPPGIGDDASFAERFAREAKAMAKLNHPGIVTIHDFGRADGLYYFVMEFIDGMNLRQLLQASRLSAREALGIVPQICDALQYAHDQGIVHRDIKPENILIDRRGRVKVADFGLAKLVGVENEPPAGGGAVSLLTALTESGKTLGTPQYMSPEQMSQPGAVDHRADIYALGVVFYQMLTGELPGKTIEPPSKKVQLDVRLDEVVLRALERNPEARYQHAGTIKTQLETIAETQEAPAPPAKSPSPGRPKWFWPIAAGIAVLLLVIFVELLNVPVVPAGRDRHISIKQAARAIWAGVTRKDDDNGADAVPVPSDDFREYAVTNTYADLVQMPNTDTPEGIAARFALGILTRDEATVIDSYSIDFTGLPAGSFHFTLPDQQRTATAQIKIPKVIIYQEELAGLIIPQTDGTGFFSILTAGKRNGEWKVAFTLDPWMPTNNFKTKSLEEAEAVFKHAAPGFLATFRTMPDPQPVPAMQPGQLLATNMSAMMNGMFSSMTQMVSQVPGVAANFVQQMTNNFGQQFSVQVPILRPATANSPGAPASHLEFRWVAADNDTTSPVDILPNESKLLAQPALRVLKPVFLDDRDIEKASLFRFFADREDLTATLTSPGQKKYQEATAKNIGRTLAMVWKGRVICAGTVTSPSTNDSISIMGTFTEAEAQQLVDLLNHRH